MKTSTYLLNASKSQREALKQALKVIDYYLCIEDVELALNGEMEK